MTECYRCGYEWNYSGSMDNPTCPSCGYGGYKTDVEAENDG